jgi:hypothetical protein
MAKGAFPFPPKGGKTAAAPAKKGGFVPGKKGVNPFAAAAKKGAAPAAPAFKKGGMVKGKKGC